MKNNHMLGLYVSYYLARFNEDGLRHLGYPTWNFAFRDISEKLQVNRHSVKHWRDQFDPLFGHRVGWYQRPMPPSREKVSTQLINLDEPRIRQIVMKILNREIKDPTEII